MRATILDGKQRFVPRVPSLAARETVRPAMASALRERRQSRERLPIPMACRRLTEDETWRAIRWTLIGTAFLVVLVLSFCSHEPVAANAMRLMGR